MILVIILGGIAFLGELLSALSRVLYPLPGWLGMVNDQQIHHGNPPVKFSMTHPWVSLGHLGSLIGSCMWGLQHHEVQMGPGGFLGALPEGGSLPPGRRVFGQRCRGGSGLAGYSDHRGGQGFGSSFWGELAFSSHGNCRFWMILDDLGHFLICVSGTGSTNLSTQRVWG